jgi:SAM-dependent methyltransferase
VTHAIEVEPHKDDYAMGRTPAEYERLRQQARILEPAARRVLEQIGLDSGMCCVDVGCGPGEVMRLRGELVGPSGRVVGVDVDSTLGAQALAMLRERGTSSFEFVEADAAQLDQLPGGECDLAYARLVLIHTQDPAVLLRRMYGWLRPGGYLVVQDFDLKGMDADAAGEAGREFLRVANRRVSGAWPGLANRPESSLLLPGGRPGKARRHGHQWNPESDDDPGPEDGRCVSQRASARARSRPHHGGPQRNAACRADRPWPRATKSGGAGRC